MTAAVRSIGTFALDRDLRIVSWDAWMARSTGRPFNDVRGRPIVELYPELAAGLKLARLMNVVESGAVEVFSPAFHHYLIPCAPGRPSKRFERMQQSATAAPLRDEAGKVVGCLVRVEDVTARRDIELDVAEDMRSPHEPTRVSATRRLADASAGDALIEALRDDSHRVRQAAVTGLVKNGDHDAVEAVIRALREEHGHPGVLNSALQVLEMLDVDVTTPLAEFLGRDDSDLRIYAAQALGMQRHPGAAEALIAALDDPDPNVRFQSIVSLGKLRAASAAGRLVEIATSGDFYLAFPAVEALASLGDATVGARIAPLLENRLLRLPVARLLGQIGDAAAAERLTVLLDDPAVWYEAAAAIAAIEARFRRFYQGGDHISAVVRRDISPSATNRLLDGLRRRGESDLSPVVRILSWLEDPRVDEQLVRLFNESTLRRDILEAMVGRGRNITELIVRQLRGDDLEARRAAITALGRIGDAGAVPALMEALKEKELAISAAGALARIGDPRAFEPMIALVGDADASIRQAAIGALNSLGHPDLPRRAKELLQSEDPCLRESAARICGYFGYADSLPDVIALINDPNDRVARAAVDSLPFYEQDKRILSCLESALENERPAVRAAAARALAQLDESAVPGLLMKALSDADPWVRYYAARSVGQIRCTEAIDRLADVARADAANQVRAGALEALGNIGGGRAASILAPFVEADSPDLARSAIQALGKIAHPDVIPPLIEALSSSDENRRIEALQALGRRGGGEAVLDLRRIAESDASQRVTAAALDALAAIGERSAVEALLDLTASPGRRDAALEALVRRCADKTRLISAGLQSAHPAVRLASVDALRRIHNRAASDELSRALDHSDAQVRLAAVNALGELGSRANDRKLSEVARTDPDESVRRAAQSALKAGAA